MYDVFISSKSKDYTIAEEVYEFLVNKGLNVFLASKELEAIGEAQYAKVIETVIDESQHMIVVASSIEHIKSTWVEREWRQFCNDLYSGYRNGNIVTILSDTINKKDLPGSLRHQQSFSMSTYMDSILGYLGVEKISLSKEKDSGYLKSTHSNDGKKSNQLKAKELFNQLVVEFEKGNNKKGHIYSIEEILSLDPYNVDYLWLAYDIYKANGKEKGCRRCIESIISIDSTDPQVLLVNGCDEFENDNIEKAQELFESIIAQKRVDRNVLASAYNNIAACLIKVEKLKEAEDYSTKAVSTLKNLATLGNLAYIQYHLGKISESWDCYEEITSLSPEYDNAYFYLALCNQKIRNYPQSIHYFKCCIEKGSNFLYSKNDIDDFLKLQYGLRYFLLTRGGGFVQTIHHSSKYRSDRCAYIDTLSLLAETFVILNDVEHTHDCYRKILSLDKTNQKALDYICVSDKINVQPLPEMFRSELRAAIEQGNKPFEALRIIDSIERSQTYTPHYEVMTCKAKMLYKIGNEDECLSLLASSITQNPHQPDATLLLASLYDQKGNYQESIRSYEYVFNDVLSSDDDILFAYNNLGIVYNKIGKPEKASSCYDSVLEGGYSAEIYFNKAFSLYKCKLYKEAIDFFNKAISQDDEMKYPCSPFLACCYIALKRNDKASTYMMQHLVEMLDEEAKDIMASFNAERYYYYGVLLSSVHVTSPNFNDKKDFFIEVALCAGQTFENLNKNKQARKIYEYVLTLDSNNYMAKAALRRLAN